MSKFTETVRPLEMQIVDAQGEMPPLQASGYPCFWRWAIDTPALRALADRLDWPLPAKLDGEAFWSWETPNNTQPGEPRRFQPWVDPDKADAMKQFDAGADRLREVMGESCGVIYTEICKLTPTAEFARSEPALIAVNSDGTRAAVLRVRFMG